MSTNNVIEDLKAKTKVIVKRAVKGGAAAVFAASLVPLGSIGSVGANEAQAVTATHMESSAVFNNGTNKWDYTFRVFNDSTQYGELGVNWELPLFNDTNFNDAIISDVVLPNDWFVELLNGPTDQSTATQAYGGYDWDSGYDSATDPNAANYSVDASEYENPDFIIHFYSDFQDFVEVVIPLNPILDPDSALFAGGVNFLDFGFSSDFGPTNAPYLMSYIFQDPAAGDPPTPGFAVLSPNHPANQQANGAVPEPLTAGLAALSSMALVGYTRRRRG